MMTAKINGSNAFVWDSSTAPLTVTNLTEFHEGKAASAAILMQGDDTLVGSLNENYLEGFGGNDTIDGSNDSDILIGGLGKDTLIGGDDGDRFVYKSVEESTVKIIGRDIIQDFTRSEQDKLDLRAIDANEDKHKNQDFNFIGEANFHKKAGELRCEKFIDGMVVYGDTDGNGRADFSIELQDVVSLKGGDLLL
jgi:Ca2+-binding RTX toxin-like protein